MYIKNRIKLASVRLSKVLVEVENFLKQRNIVLLLVIFSILSSFIILFFGPAILPLAFFFIFILYIFVNFDNSIVLAIGIMSMMNIAVMHIGIIDLRMSQLLWAPILLMALLRQAFHFGIRSPKLETKLKIILFILVACSFLSIIQSNYPLVSLRESIQLLYFVAIFVIIVKEVNSQYKIRKVTAVILFFSLIFIVFGLLKFILGNSLIPFVEIDNLNSISFTQTPLKEQYTFSGDTLFRRADVFFLGPVATAAYLIPIVILAASLLFNKDLFVSSIRRLCYFCSFFGSLMIILTFSRAGTVVLMLLLLLLCVLKRRFPKHLVIILVCFFVVLFFSSAQKMRLLEITSLGEQSTQIHFIVWKQAIAMFLSRPILGYGAGTFNYQSFIIDAPLVYLERAAHTAAHNMFLLLAAETGLLGVSSLIIFLFVVTRHIWVSLRREQVGYLYNIKLGFFLGIIGLILMNLTMNFFTVEIFWIFLALGYATANIIENEKKDVQLIKKS